MKRRVVITGLGLATPIGHDLESISFSLQNDRHGITAQPEWSAVDQLMTRLAGAITDLDFKNLWPRKRIRTMGRLGLLATFATDRAIEQSQLDAEFLKSSAVGLAYGSTHGSTTEQERFITQLITTHSLKGIAPTEYLKFMSHTCAANLSQLYGIRGRIITTCSACVSASQAIGYGYEAVRNGAQEVMICGGAEEMHHLHAGVFDIMYATSTRYNEKPDSSPRPFDKNRDGLVVAEGAGTLILESYEHAMRRNAPILGEILGFATNCDGTHVTSPSTEGMRSVIELALKDAQLEPAQIDYINAHATATLVGDVCEAAAVREVFADRTPISSTKGFTGHTLGACGAIELAFCLSMMADGFLAPNRNLDTVDPECAGLDFVMGRPRPAKPKICMSNNFAFGGINTSLIVTGA